MKCLKFDVLTDQDCEAIEAFLFEQGASVVTFEDAKDDPILEPKPGETLLWAQNHLTAWFETDLDLTSLKTNLASQFPLLSYNESEIEAQDWQAQFQQHFKPVYFEDQLCVCPSWDSQPDPEIPTLYLDPGLAFGTGTHPTTYMCLQWLAKHLSPGQTVLDYGCGSGILGLAALKLGASHVWAVDYDPQAQQSTLSNAEKNKITPDQIKVLAVDPRNPIPPVDIIVANILAEPLIELGDVFKNYFKKTTTLVLSGLLAEQVQRVTIAYESWAKITEQKQIEDWVCLVLQIKTN